MVKSMTGLGVGEFLMNGVTYTVEIRSVNNRFLEISTRFPGSVSQYEHNIRELIRKKIERGKLYITVSVQQSNGESLGLRVAPDKARLIRDLLTDLKAETGIQEDLSLDHILKFSEIFEAGEGGVEADEHWKGIQEALNAAVESLDGMRQKEGALLCADLKDRIRNMSVKVDAIDRLAQENQAEKHQKLVERIQQLLEQHAMDEDRLYTEIAILTDKLDVTEECVRLKSHNQVFTETLENGHAVGKKLNFLLQEMNREVNTISSKASHVEISHIVVEMKEEIEKLREQVQNLE